MKIEEIVEKGFTITNDDELNHPLLNKCKLRSITILDDFMEWHYQHLPPEQDSPNFQFNIGSDQNGRPYEEFSVNLPDFDIKLTYNIKTHLQVIKLKKV